MKWPWRVREELAHQEAEAAERESAEKTEPLIRRAEEVVRESVRHRRQNHFREGIEDLMRRKA